MTDSQTVEADRALEAALTASGARDPRELYRERLRELKRVSPEAYTSAVAYYTETLIPQVAAGERDPLEAWTEYGRRLAAALAPGHTLGIDETGRAHPWERHEPDRLVLHLPDEKGGRALLVGLPPTLSDAQRATYDVLVAGKQRFGAGDVPE
ncbi:MAG TPA: hypothetical protein VMM35_08865 [Longimicrobiales bacterium]|nr:hypothetical protein [Longimicrobiales bacterium]